MFADCIINVSAKETPAELQLRPGQHAFLGQAPNGLLGCLQVGGDLRGGHRRLRLFFVHAADAANAVRTSSAARSMARMTPETLFASPAVRSTM